MISSPKIKQYPFDYTNTLFCDKVQEDITIKIETVATESFNNELYVSIGKVLKQDCPIWSACTLKTPKKCPLYIKIGEMASKAIEQKMSQDRRQKRQKASALGKHNWKRL